MNGIRFLVPDLTAVWILAFAAAAPAPPGYRSRLLAVTNVGKAPDDTKVSALIDGETVAKTMTMDGVAFVKIPGTGTTAWKEMEFRSGTWWPGNPARTPLSVRGIRSGRPPRTK